MREVQKHLEPEKPEKGPAPGAFGGLFYGVIAMPMLIIVGTMLCLTGLGAFLGVPMIIAGVFAPLMGPLVGMSAVKGKCPWCGAATNSVANTKDFDCRECGKRIAIKSREFVPAA
jgi:DNA-directed RNA polymerase subunit RPC12/RpoP